MIDRTYSQKGRAEREALRKKLGLRLQGMEDGDGESPGYRKTERAAARPGRAKTRGQERPHGANRSPAEPGAA